MPSVASPLSIAGEHLLLDPSGAVWWPARRMLAVADLHLEKGSAAAMRGSLLPPWDTSATLTRLARVLHQYQPESVIALGDSFHDRHGLSRMRGSDASHLHKLTRQARFLWVLGNHDPVIPAGLAGSFHGEHSIARLLFRHEAGAPPHGMAELCGHHHPKASVPVRGAWLTRPCFVVSEDRIMLPAFGAYTGGLDVAAPAIARLFPHGGRIFLRGNERLFAFSLQAALSRRPGMEIIGSPAKRAD